MLRGWGIPPDRIFFFLKHMFSDIHATSLYYMIACIIIVYCIIINLDPYERLRDFGVHPILMSSLFFHAHTLIIRLTISLVSDQPGNSQILGKQRTQGDGTRISPGPRNLHIKAC